MHQQHGATKMAHFLAIQSKKPNAVQKRQITSALKEFDKDLALCIGSNPGEAACYVEAPDCYGSNDVDTTARCESVRAIVATYMQ
jgi:hypothetical protein